MKISEAFDLYINEYSVIKNQSRATQAHYTKFKDNIIKFLGDIPVEKLDFAKISNWMQEVEKGRKSNTAREYLCGLRMVLKYLDLREIECIKWQLIPVPQREPVVPAFLTSDEVARMIDGACNLRAKLIISLLYSSGIRLSELIALNRGQIAERRFTVIGKGKKARLCFIDERTERLLDQYQKTRKDNHEALIVSRDKKRMTATNIQLLVRNAAKRAGLEGKHVHPHTLRHSFATNFLQNNGNLRYLSALMGHANLNTTAIYTHVIDVDLEKQYKKFHSV